MTTKALIKPPTGKPFLADLLGETDKGLLARTGPNDSPAIEWFPFWSKLGWQCEKVEV